MPIDNINDITISRLKINLNTNIPNNPSVTLTYELLYQPVNKKDKIKENEKDVKLIGTFPFFTFDVKYSKEILYKVQSG